jgi:hypothetical protein
VTVSGLQPNPPTLPLSSPTILFLEKERKRERKRKRKRERKREGERGQSGEDWGGGRGEMRFFRAWGDRDQGGERSMESVFGGGPCNTCGLVVTTMSFITFVVRKE